MLMFESLKVFCSFIQIYSYKNQKCIYNKFVIKIAIKMSILIHNMYGTEEKDYWDLNRYEELIFWSVVNYLFNINMVFQYQLNEDNQELHN